MNRSRRHEIAGWLEEPHVYVFLVPDELRHELGKPCDVDRVSRETLALIWPPERGTFEIIPIEDERYAASLDILLAKIVEAADGRAVISITDYKRATLEWQIPKSEEETTILKRHLRIAILKAKDT